MVKRVHKKPPGKRIVKNKKKKRRVAARKRKKTVAPPLKRSKANPIILPKPENSWEAWQTFNPGTVLLNDRVYFLYRAIGQDGVSRLGYAASKDGFSIDERHRSPAYEHRISQSVFNYYSFASGGSFGGAEDPRLTRVNEEDVLYMTYTACDNGLGVGLTSIKISDFLNPGPEQARYGAGKKWKWKPPVLISPPGEVHKNWVIFPEKVNGKYAILTSISPKILITYRDTLNFKKGEHIQSFYNCNSHRENCWDNWLRGAGAPPIKTRLGWLLFYQAMDKDDPGKYKTGAMILDFNDPTQITHRTQEPVLEPEKDYENNGFKAGVVYVTGTVVKNEELLVYYGASDSYIGIAHAPLEEFVETMAKESPPKLKIRILKERQPATII